MAADEPPSRMKRKVYEKELEKLQVQLCHLQAWVKANKLRVIVLFEGRDAAGKGRHDQGNYRESKSARVQSGRAPLPLRPREIAAISAAVHAAFPCCRRDRPLRSQLVQPRRRRICDGLLYANRTQALSFALPADGEIHRRRWHHPDQALA